MTKLVKGLTIDCMSTQVNLYEAKTQLSALVERAARGEEIVIAKSGRPMARVRPCHSASEPTEIASQRSSPSDG